MFPPNPNVGDQVTLPDGRVFEWDGTRWNLVQGGGGGGALTDPTTTRGDLIVRGATAVTRLGVGSNDQVLTADSAATLGVAWKTGAAAASYVHVESAPAEEWEIPHNLGFRYVSVQVVSDAGNLIIPDIDWVSATRVDLIFSRAVSGTAIIRK
jgi:hypothetical protein